MTKVVPPIRLLLKNHDGNQEDELTFDSSSRSSKVRFSLQQQQSPDEDAQSSENRRRPTLLEELLDLELDLILPVTAIPATRNNQMPVGATNEELGAGVDSVSLELLAMQSPHGENQQWQSEEEEQDMASGVSFRPEEQSPRRTTKKVSAPRKPMPLRLVPPRAFTPSFPPSPSHPSTDDDYGLASPMALPETPSQSRTGITLAWDLRPPSPTYEDTNPRAGTSRCFTQSKSVQKPERRASHSSVAARAATPNPRNQISCTSDTVTSRASRSALPTLPEGRRKTIHGGIYSLLLKNKSMKQEPVLVEDANPEDMTTAPSDSKESPPRTFGKQKHGSIYKLLRASHGDR